MFWSVTQTLLSGLATTFEIFILLQEGEILMNIFNQNREFGVNLHYEKVGIKYYFILLYCSVIGILYRLLRTQCEKKCACGSHEI